jgi:hypothetical protein
MSDNVINKTRPFFYIKDLRTGNSIWEVTEIIKSEPNRLGWLNCVCIDPGTDTNIYKGSPMGVDAAYVFMSRNYDYSKNLQALQ